MKLSEIISRPMGIKPTQAEHVIDLIFNKGATVPFISRYRKEATGGLDEVAVEAIRAEYVRLTELDKRKESIRGVIEEQGKLTEELARRIDECYNISELEDLYLPFRPRRRTRATAARENGLEPLAGTLMKQHPDIETLARRFTGDKIASAEEALQGASDIIAEWVSENAGIRSLVRRYYSKGALIGSKVVKGKEEEAGKYRDYFEFSEPLRRSPSHRILAMIRGQKEGFLRLGIALPDDTDILREATSRYVKDRTNRCAHYIKKAVEDSYKRLIKPSMESEFFTRAKEKAEQEAIEVFARNLRQLLLAPPLGQKRVLAIDPGFRTGCKVVCLDGQGNLLHNETIYPHAPQKQETAAMARVAALADTYKIEAIAIGNGTAGRETEELIRKIRFGKEIRIFPVSEDGASVYSASAAAREEFPDYDVTVRGAVSIGRRLIDPLAELVKIDPKAIGVGQYQHDVDQAALKEALDRVVESCVNRVGVNLNTASRHLLTYVSGIGPVMAANIVAYRAEHGDFDSRRELLKVPRLGEKAFEQCAGFLRIPGAKNPLDDSAVHPESYPVVERMAADMGVKVSDLLRNDELVSAIDLTRYADGGTGLPTLRDIAEELKKPGRDPRSEIQDFEFSKEIASISDLSEGMVLPGIVSNITNFGAFVDIGIKTKGLVHISEASDRFVTDINEVLKLHQQVRVKVLGIDEKRERISLTLKL